MNIQDPVVQSALISVLDLHQKSADAFRALQKVTLGLETDNDSRRFGRAVAIAITHAETSFLWCREAGVILAKVGE